MEEFIENIKENECLYNKNSTDYMNLNKKEQIWKSLSEQFNCNAKTKWQYLREKYNKEKVNLTLPSGSGAPAKSCAWTHFSALSFLDDHIKPRKMRENTSIVEPEIQESSSFAAFDENDFDIDANLDASTSTTLNSSYTKEPPKKRKKEDIDLMFVQTLNDFQKKLSGNTDEDEDWLFLKSIRMKIKKMAPGNKRRFKIKMLKEADDAAGEF